jgi:TonB family protein
MSSLRVTVLLVATLLFGTAWRTQNPVASSYPDSPDGFRQQLEDLVSAYKSGDQATFHAALEALAIPNADEWIARHFAPADVPKLQHDYPLSLDGFQQHASWVASNAARLPGWEMTAKPSELPPPPAAAPEQSVPSPGQQVFVENFRYGPLHPEAPAERSWVNSFVYVDGRFRYVGGTYPFWWEDLQRIRRPLAGDVHAARLIYKVAPEYPKKAREKRVEGVVRLRVVVGKDGTLHGFTVVTGDPLLTEAAIKAVRHWRYTPTLLDGQPVEVSTTIDVTFQLNRKN